MEIKKHIPLWKLYLLGALIITIIFLINFVVADLRGVEFTESNECSCNINVSSFGNISGKTTNTHIPYSSGNNNLIDISCFSYFGGILEINESCNFISKNGIDTNGLFSIDGTIDINTENPNGIINLIAGPTESQINLNALTTTLTQSVLNLNSENTEITGTTHSTGDIQTDTYFIGNGSELTDVCLTNGSNCKVISVNFTNVAFVNNSNTFTQQNDFNGNLNSNNGLFILKNYTSKNTSMIFKTELSPAPTVDKLTIYPSAETYLQFGTSSNKWYQTDFSYAGYIIMPSFASNINSGISTVSNYAYNLYGYYGVEVLGNRHTTGSPTTCQEGFCDASSLMVVAGRKDSGANAPALNLYGYSGGQTANMMEIKNSSNVLLAYWNGTGAISTTGYMNSTGSSGISGIYYYANRTGGNCTQTFSQGLLMGAVGCG